MTVVLAWYSQPSCFGVLHLATDSLVCQTGTRAEWCHATKIFRVYPSHSYIAYCGDSFYGVSAIAQGIGLLSKTEKLVDEGAPLAARAHALGEHVRRVFETFPRCWGQSATLLFCGYDACLGGIGATKIELTSGSYSVSNAIADGARYAALGSGAAFVRERLTPRAGSHSRDVFGTLTAAIESPSLNTVGGYPEAVTLFCYRNAPGRTSSTVSGFNWRCGQRLESTLFGMPIRFASGMSSVVWRTSVFTRSRYLRAARVRRLSG